MGVLLITLVTGVNAEYYSTLKESVRGLD